MPSNVCSIVGCRSASTKMKSTGESVVFFSFPKDPVIAQQWIEKSSREYFHPNNKKVCSKHFKLDDYEDELEAQLRGLQPRKLKENAIPSLNLSLSRGWQKHTAGKKRLSKEFGGDSTYRDRETYKPGAPKSDSSNTHIPDIIHTSSKIIQSEANESSSSSDANTIKTPPNIFFSESSDESLQEDVSHQQQRTTQHGKSSESRNFQQSHYMERFMSLQEESGRFIEQILTHQQTERDLKKRLHKVEAENAMLRQKIHEMEQDQPKQS